MNKRLTILLLAVLTATAACKAPDPATPAATTEPAATPAAASPAAPAAPAAPVEVAVDPAADAAAAAALDAAGGGAPLVAGTDYIEIRGGQPFEPLNGQVEVAEVFGYVCPACAQFQPLMTAWKRKLPSDVRVTYVPALFGGTWDRYARAYYASEAMGLVDRSHDALYQAIHVQQSLKGERGQDSEADIARFFSAYGASPEQFTSTMASFTVEGKLNRAKQFAMRSGIEGTPTLVVNGKYRVKGQSFEDMLRITSKLVAQERAAGGDAPPASAGATDADAAD